MMLTLKIFLVTRAATATATAMMIIYDGITTTSSTE
jgi:hypothetical protein